MAFKARAKSAWFVRLCAAAGLACASGAAFGQGATTCAGAQPMVLQGSGGAGLALLVDWDASGASDARTPACGREPQPEVWFAFDPTTSGVLSLHSQNGTIIVDDGCGGTELFCASAVLGPAARAELAVEAGHSYRVAIELASSDYSTGGPFHAAFSPNGAPANDLCGNATPAVMGVNLFDNRNADTESSAPCAASDRDVWFSFVAPAAGVYRFQSTGLNHAAIVDAVVSVLDSCGGTTLKCSDNVWGNGGLPGLDARVDLQLSAGQDVRVRVASKAASTGIPNVTNIGVGELTVGLTPLLPNDVCTGATPVLAGTTRVSTLGSFDDSTPACISGLAGIAPETWHVFTPATSGVVSIAIKDVYPFNFPRLSRASVAAYAGCPQSGGALIACRQLTLDFSGKIWLCGVPVQAGVPLYIQVATEAPGGSVDLVISPPGSPPVNGSCQTATQVGTGNHAFETTYACGAAAELSGVWFRYTNTNANVRSVRFQTCGSNFDTIIYTQHNCEDIPNGFVHFNDDGKCTDTPTASTLRVCLNPQESILVCVSSLYGTGAGVLNITANAPAANDTCATALTLNIGNTSVNTTLGCGFNDSAELPCPFADFDSDRGVWYSYTATQNGFVVIEPERFLGIAVFDGCGGSQIACTNTEYRTELSFPVVAGQTYKVAFTEIASVGVTTDFGTVRVRSTFIPGEYAISEDAIPEIEPCNVSQFNTVFCPAGELFTLESPARTGTMRSFDRFAVIGDLADEFDFEISAPGTVRFSGQTRFAGYIEIYNNIDPNDPADECFQSSVYTLDLTDPWFNTFDTGPVELPYAGRHTIALFVSDQYWRLCEDNDINYWIRMDECTTCGTPCPADFNTSGSVTVQDIFDFLSAWFAGTPSADFNHVGGVTVQDIFDFLGAWFAGC